MNRVHFVGAIRPHTPRCDATPPPEKDAPAAVVSDYKWHADNNSIQSPNTKQRGGVIISVIAGIRFIGFLFKKTDNPTLKSPQKG